MAVYKIHKQGEWARLRDIERLERIIDYYEKMNENMQLKYDRIIKSHIAKHYCFLSVQYKKDGILDKAKSYAIQSLLKYLVNKRVPARCVFVMLLRLYTPFLYKLLKTVTRSFRSFA